MTAFTGMLKFQPLAETVMVIVTSHSPVISRPICKLNKPIHLISAVINSAAKIRRFALSLQSQEIVIFSTINHHWLVKQQNPSNSIFLTFAVTKSALLRITAKVT
jgi:hypothetical protein